MQQIANKYHESYSFWDIHGQWAYQAKDKSTSTKTYQTTDQRSKHCDSTSNCPIYVQ